MGTVHTFPHDDNATPTTRFIRNCEAVGLFNDLPPNPFEETFRMATANDLSHSLKNPSPKRSTEETLNTPRVISSSSNANQLFQSLGPAIDDDEDVVVLNDFLEPILPKTPDIPSTQNEINSNDSSDVEIVENTPQVNSTTKSIPTSIANSNINFENIIFTVSDNVGKSGSVEGFFLDPTSSQSACSSVTVNFTPNKELILPNPFVDKAKDKTTEKCTSPAIYTSNLTAKSVNVVKNPNIVYKLAGTNIPAILSGKNVVILPSKSTSKSTETSFPKVASQPVSENRNQNDENNVKQKLKNFLQNSNSSQNIETDISMREELLEANRDSNSVSSVEEEKKEFSRERNRMAQKRCRMKKKRYFTQLKNETENALIDNRKLGSLVHSLQAEIAHLKTLLLAHRNCSVTRAMYKADLKTIMNNKVSEIVEDVEIPASDDADGHSSPRQITCRQLYNQLHGQHVNQVNHIHVHVPSSPETGGSGGGSSGGSDYQLLNFAPDPNLFAATFPSRRSVLDSGGDGNKRLICDSKVVRIRTNELMPKKATNSPSSAAGNRSTLPEGTSGGNRKPSLKIFINGNEASVAECGDSVAATSPAVCFAVSGCGSSSPDVSSSASVIKLKAKSGSSVKN